MGFNPSDKAEEARYDLGKFAEYCMHDIKENTWFHKEWYATIQDYNVKSGLIIAPRNSAKSTAWGRVAPLWLLGCDPDLRIVIVGRTATTAENNLRFIKTQIESNDRVKEVFPHQKIGGTGGRVSGLKESSPWGSSQITVENNRLDGMPSVYAVGVGGSISGIRADIIIVDDLIDSNNVMTENQREKVLEFWNSVIIPTLNPGGRIFLVGTRYHAKDFYALALEDPMYEGSTFQFPALKLYEKGHKKESELILTPKLDDDGNETFDEEGEKVMTPISYWPERWPVFELLKIKERMGSLAFNSQYQCDPSGYSGRLFDPDHLHYYDPETALEAVWGNLEFVMSVDPNVTAAPESDNMAVVTAAVDRKNGKVYVLDIYAKPHDFVGQLNILKRYGSRTQVRVGNKTFQPEAKISKIWIEAIAYQRALQQSGYLMGLPVVGVKNGNMDKSIRILRMQPHIENGRILFPDPSKTKFNVSWWDAFYEEYCTFDKGRRDDMIDALEMIVTQMSPAFDVSGIPWGPSSSSQRRQVWMPDRGGRFVFG